METPDNVVCWRNIQEIVSPINGACDYWYGRGYTVYISMGVSSIIHVHIQMEGIAVYIKIYPGLCV